MKNFLVHAAVVALFAAAAAQAEVHKVDIVGFTFRPAQIVIAQGDTVVFTNTSTGRHTVTDDPSLVANPASVVLPEGAEAFHSGTMAPGATFTHDFTVAGSYQYVCLPHERMGMKGQIVVAPAPEDIDDETY